MTTINKSLNEVTKVISGHDKVEPLVRQNAAINDEWVLAQNTYQYAFDGVLEQTTTARARTVKHSARKIIRRHWSSARVRLDPVSEESSEVYEHIQLQRCCRLTPMFCSRALRLSTLIEAEFSVHE